MDGKPTNQGKVGTLDYMSKCYFTAKKHGLGVHLDSARFFNAAANLNVDVKEITKYSDTLLFCLSKGLCAPVGSMICGTNEYI